MRKPDTGLNLDDYEAEARLHIEKIEAAFIDASDLANDPHLVNELFRAVHSLKGAAGLFSLQKVVRVAHELESVFLHIKDGKLAVSDKIADVILQSVDCLRDLTDNTRDDDAIDISEVLEVLREYSELNESDGAASDTRIPFNCRSGGLGRSLREAARLRYKIYYIKINFNRGLGKYYKRPESLVGNVSSVSSIEGVIIAGIEAPAGKSNAPAWFTEEIRKALAKSDSFKLELLVTSVLDIEMLSVAIEIEQRHIHIVPLAAVLKEGEGNKAIKPETAANRREGGYSIRLDVSAINDLMDLANEMILTRNRLLSAVSGFEDSIQNLNPILHDINRLSSDIQERLMLTRMQPISIVFSKFPRIIRDTAKALNKEIRVESFGGDVMLDKYLLDALTDPITQIVKNSADHGIEVSERRAELDKPKRGTITLNAFMREGLAVIEISDDGAGINVEKLRSKIIEKGLVDEESLSDMSDEEVFEVVFVPGFSTARKVTSLSGRGVGMDIVKTNIEKLGGAIEIESEVDRGTTMRLKMPLNLTVIRILIIAIDSVKYAVPEINVERIIRVVGNGRDEMLERVNNSLALRYGGRVIPVVTMGGIAAKVRNAEPPTIDSLIERSCSGEAMKFLVLKSAGKNFSIHIDAAEEMVETLIKPLPVFLKNCPCYSNVTVLGDGNALTILDVEGILRVMNIETEEASALEDERVEDGRVEDERVEDESVEYEADKMQVFVFKCSGDEYFALEASDISRIETINREHIQRIGEGGFVNIADRTVRVIMPEDYAPVQNPGYFSKKLYLLMLKKSASQVGILAGKVLDKIEGDFTLDNSQLRCDCIIGTGVFNEKVLVFLNPDVLLEKVNNGEK